MHSKLRQGTLMIYLAQCNAWHASEQWSITRSTLQALSLVSCSTPRMTCHCAADATLTGTCFIFDLQRAMLSRMKVDGCGVGKTTILVPSSNPYTIQAQPGRQHHLAPLICLQPMEQRTYQADFGDGITISLAHSRTPSP